MISYKNQEAKQVLVTKDMVDCYGPVRPLQLA